MDDAVVKGMADLSDAVSNAKAEAEAFAATAMEEVGKKTAAAAAAAAAANGGGGEDENEEDEEEDLGVAVARGGAGAGGGSGGAMDVDGGAGDEAPAMAYRGFIGPAAAAAAAELDPAWGLLRTKHSTDVESPPPPPRVCMSIHPEGKSCSDLRGVLVLNDPPARR